MHAYMTPSVIKRKSSNMATALALADALSFYCALALVALVLISSLRDNHPATAVAKEATEQVIITNSITTVKGNQLVRRPCEEIYVVGEGETLHTISDKCGDPFIVERNPHIHDPDDVFPGLVINLNPSKHTRDR